MTNLSHPTLSLNHNWTNAHCLSRLYDALCAAVEETREAIEDVRVMLESSSSGEKVGWEKEFEEEVRKIVEADTGGG